MTTIQPGTDLLTVVVVFTVPPEEQTGLVQRLERVAEEHFQLEGFVSCAIHPSEDGLRVVGYIQWRSRADFAAMLAVQTPDGHVNPPLFPADVRVHQVATVVEC